MSVTKNVILKEGTEGRKMSYQKQTKTKNKQAKTKTQHHHHQQQQQPNPIKNQKENAKNSGEEIIAVV